MNPSIRSLIACALLAGPAAADKLNLLDGKTVDCTVVRESLDGVVYKLDGKGAELTAKNDAILSIEFESRPRLLLEAESRVSEGALDDAITLLQEYVEGVQSGDKKERVLWAPAFAMHRLVELSANQGDAAGVVAATGRLIQGAPDSRWVPEAWLAQAQALTALSKPDDARKSLAALRALIDQKGLGPRWSLECDLESVASDAALTGAGRRVRLEEIATRAGDKFPTVRNHARVAIGQSHLEGEQKDFDAAGKIFQSIIEEGRADPTTLAGAYAGLGDCLFTAAVVRANAKQDAKPLLQDALLAYMRVVCSYKDQPAYRSKAMLFAGKVLETLGDDASRAQARRLWSALVAEYGSSPLADQARAKLGR